MMFYAAFMIGLMGSLHCLGMCGPIAFALPVRTSNTWIKLLKYIIYNAGRILTYTILGLIIGSIGKGFAIAGLQQIISIASGGLIIISVLLVHFSFRTTGMNNLLYRVSSHVKSLFHMYLKKTGIFSLFMLGVVNGLLPCGMVYMAMLGALATGSYLSGAAFMALFGLGTVPMMLSISLMGNMMTVKLRSMFNKLIPVVGCVVGLLLILRGLDVEVPFLNQSDSCCQTHKCH